MSKDNNPTVARNVLHSIAETSLQHIHERLDQIDQRTPTNVFTILVSQMTSYEMAVTLVNGGDRKTSAKVRRGANQMIKDFRKVNDKIVRNYERKS